MSKPTKLPDGIEAFIQQNRKICWEAEFENGNYCIGEDKVRDFFTKFIVPELTGSESKDELVRELVKGLKELKYDMDFFGEYTAGTEDKVNALISKASGQSNSAGKDTNSAHSYTEGSDL